MPLPYLEKLRGVRVRQNGVDVANAGRVAGLDFLDSVVTYDSETGFVTIEIGGAIGDLEVESLSGAANTLTLTQARKLLRVSHGSATTLTVPPNATAAFAVGTRILLEQDGAGQLTVAAGIGVTIRSQQTLKARAQYSTLELIKLATNEWVLLGDLERSGSDLFYEARANLTVTGNVSSTPLTFTGSPEFEGASGLYQVNVYVRIATAGTTGDLQVNILHDDGADEVVTWSTEELDISDTEIRAQSTFTLRSSDGAISYSVTGVGTAGSLSARVQIFARQLFGIEL